MPNGSPLKLFLLLIPLTLLLGACSSDQADKDAASKAPPPGVLVARIGQRQIKDTIEYLGRTVAVKDVSLRAQVSGYLQERLFDEGAEIEVGDPLFQIDPAIYQAQVAAAKGDVAKAEAARTRAAKDLKRYRELLKKNSISRQQVDQAESDKLQAEAELVAAKAALEKTETDLSFTLIKAPIKGRIGRALISVGNLVGPQSGELARLVELDPIYVNFNVSERDILDIKQRRLKQGGQRVPGDVEVDLRLANKSIYAHKGALDFIDNVVDPKTGTVTVRARFDNPDRLLVPGLYVTVILGTQERKTELLVPQPAVQEDQAGRFVMLVNPEDEIERRRISTGRQVEGELVVTGGLEPDERVVVEGIQKVRPGMKVAPKEAVLPGSEDLAGDTAAATEGDASPGQAPATEPEGDSTSEIEAKGN